MAQDVEVVMFFGPPFAGKTLYYRRCFERSHERVSAVDLFADQPDLGLRQVILRIVTTLKRGTSVVIDDDNWSRATRRSYVASISAKVPACKFRCLTFSPPSQLTTRWLQEWHLANGALCRDLPEPRPDELAKRDAAIRRWFGEDGASEKSLQRPEPTEGYSLQDIPVQLTTEEDFKFEVPALFIQWEGICQSQEDESSPGCREGAAEVIEAWASACPWGRVVVVAASADGGDPEVRHQDFRRVKKAVGELVQHLSIPVYLCCLLGPPSDRPFAEPPSPGLLSFLQKFHRIHLWHAATRYLHHTPDHEGAVRSAGLRRSPAATALGNPNWLEATGRLPETVSGAALDDVVLIEAAGSGPGRSAPTVPLYAEAVEALTAGGCYARELSCGRAVGLCYKDRDTLDRYQKLYADTASRVSESGSRMAGSVQQKPTTAKRRKDDDGSAVNSKCAGTSTVAVKTSPVKRGLPSWMMAQSMKSKEAADPCPNGPPRKKKTDEPSMPRTVYCMSPVELYETALLILQEDKQAGGLSEEDGKNAAVSSSSSPQRVKKTLSGSEHPSLGKEGHTEAVASPSDSEEEEETKEAPTGGCHFLDEIFPDRAAELKPPPQKSKNLNSPTSFLDKPLCLAPETVSCVPDTAGFAPPSEKMESTSSCLGKSPAETKNEESKVAKGPDLSFLDDIF